MSEGELSSLDLSALLGLDALDLDAGESWEKKGDVTSDAPATPAPLASPVPEPTQETEPAGLRDSTLSTYRDSSSSVTSTGSALGAAWAQHCRQLEQQQQERVLSSRVSAGALAALAEGSGGSSSDSSGSGSGGGGGSGSGSSSSSGSAPPPPPPPPPDDAMLNDLPLQDILDELAVLLEAAHAGRAYDERRLEELMLLQEGNAEYRQQCASEQEAWRCGVDSFLCEALLRMRSYVPPDIFTSTHEGLLHLGLTPGLAKRVLKKQCLWLTRMGPDEIARLHEADLNGRFNTAGEALDLTELAAVYASLPERFVNDRLGKKVEWRDGVEAALKRAMEEEGLGTLAEGRLRCALYEAFLDDTGPVRDLDSVREASYVRSEGSQGPRTSFQEVCKRHSILRRRSITSESEASNLSLSFSSSGTVSP